MLLSFLSAGVGSIDALVDDSPMTVMIMIECYSFAKLNTFPEYYDNQYCVICSLLTFGGQVVPARPLKRISMHNHPTNRSDRTTDSTCQHISCRQILESSLFVVIIIPMFLSRLINIQDLKRPYKDFKHFCLRSAMSEV